jgi:tRNA threonylcarbamoyladenosine dehydratase
MTDSGWQSRTRLLIGDEAADRLRDVHVLVMGMGGVGSFCAEFLARAGVDVMRERLRLINPELRITAIKEFMTPSHMERVLAARFDHVVDAIDSLTPKVYLLVEAVKRGYPIVSSMGAGGKLDPTLIRVADIAETQRCALARYVRKRLKKHGIATGITAVYSLEETDDASLMYTDGSNFKKSAFGTISYLPAAFGGACASVVIRSLVGKDV